MHSRIANNNGQAMIVVGIGLATLAFVGLVAVAVDTAHIAHTATEVQTVADAAATAGASALMQAFRDGTTNAVAQAMATSDARSVAAQNSVEGHAPIADGGAANNVTIDSGNYNAATGAFSSGVNPLNAVRASVTATVSNIVAGIWSPATTVTKIAIAALRSSSQNSPDLPLMIGSCYYTPPTDCANPTSTLVDFPNGQRSTGWTNFNMDASNIKLLDALKASDYSDPAKGPFTIATTLPATWCAAPLGGKDLCGGGLPLPKDPVELGDTFQLLDKAADQSTFILGDGIVNHGTDTFTVPLTDCVDSTTKSMATVTGFATIKIDAAQFLDPSWDKKHWTITFLCSPTDPGPIGGGNFGTGVVTLVR